MKRNLVTLFSMVLLAVILFSGCAAGNSKSDAEYDCNGSAEYESAPSESADIDYSDGSLDNSALSDDGKITTGDRKVIFSSYFSIETKDFDSSCKALEKLINCNNAYIESSEIYSGNGISSYKYRNKSASYTVRVPSENYNSFLSDSGSIGTVVSKSDNNRDVTESYYDTEARLKTLKTKEERLLTLLGTSTYIDDIISLNNALEETMYEIETLTGTLKKYDSLISYSTVSISITEVSEITEIPEVNESFGTRISSAFKNSLKGLVNFFADFAVLLVSVFPAILIIGAIAAVITVSAVKSKKRKAKKKAEQEAK